MGLSFVTSGTWRPLGHSDRLHFLGRRLAEVRMLMGSADAVVVPSRVEAFGIVVLEAWASGTPVLASGGPAGFVTDGHDGLLIAPLDTSNITLGIDSVMLDSDLSARLVQACRGSVFRFTWEKVVDEYERFFEHVCELDCASR